MSPKWLIIIITIKIYNHIIVCVLFNAVLLVIATFVASDKSWHLPPWLTSKIPTLEAVLPEPHSFLIQISKDSHPWGSTSWTSFNFVPNFQNFNFRLLSLIKFSITSKFSFLTRMVSFCWSPSELDWSRLWAITTTKWPGLGAGIDRVLLGFSKFAQ